MPPDRAENDALKGELEAAVDEEARRGGRFTVPFLLPTLYIVRVILGAAFELPAVKVAVGVEVALVFLRWAILLAASRSGGRSAAWRRLLLVLSTGSAWAMSAGFGAMYLAASSSIDAVQVMTLTALSAVVCSVAILSLAARLWSYIGYIAINLGAIVVVMLQHDHGGLVPGIPFAVPFYAAVLVVMATRSNRVLREKILLGLRLRESALRDALTALPNRYFMTEHVAHVSAAILDEWTAGGQRRRAAPKRSLALFVVDLDHFKRINDVYGHAGGDAVLVGFAKAAQSAVRTPDVVARWGGEEFLVLMQVTDRDSVRAIGERIGRRVAAHAVEVPGKGNVSVTCSIGVALFPFDTKRPGEISWEETVVLADCALYEAKGRGRDQTCWLRPGPGSASPREALAAARESLGDAIRAGTVAVEGEVSRAGARGSVGRVHVEGRGAAASA